MSVVRSVFAEFSPTLKVYNIYIRLRQDKDHNSNIYIVKLTPTPDALYISIDDSSFAINTLAPILSLENSVSNRTEDYLHIRIPCQTDRQSANPDFQPDMENVSVVKCRACEMTLVENVLETLPLPTSNWEILSELWNCHPSHNQYAPIEMRDSRCYSGLFFYAFKTKLDKNRYKLSEISPFIECLGCGHIVGFADKHTIELSSNVISFYKHRVRTNEGNLFNIADLTSNALLYNANYWPQREMNIGMQGGISIRMLSWDVYTLQQGQFKPSLKLLVKSTDSAPGIPMPLEDINSLHSSILQHSELIPLSTRTHLEWNIGYLNRLD